MLTQILENIGLTQKEAKIYLANLEIGSSPVSKIAQKAKINRVTTYDILEKLVKKGLINFLVKSRIKFFSSTDPELVVNEFNRRTNELQSALPDLKRLHGDTVHPRVRYFEGLEGIKSIYADTLTSKTEILNYGNSKEIRIHWPTYDVDYVQQRAEKNIQLRGIAPDDEYGRWVKSRDNDFLREIRLVSQDKFNFTNEIHIYDEKVAIISFKDELIGTIIESPEIANTQRAIFKIVWEFCENKQSDMTIRKVGSIKNKPEKKTAPEQKQEEPSEQAQLF